MRNKNMVNDGVVDTHYIAPKQPAFNISTNTFKNNQSNKSDNNQPKPSAPKQQRKFTPLG